MASMFLTNITELMAPFCSLNESIFFSSCLNTHTYFFKDVDCRIYELGFKNLDNLPPLPNISLNRVTHLTIFSPCVILVQIFMETPMSGPI